MQKPNIILIDDQRDVLTAVRKDLSFLESYFTLEECESADEAQDVLEEIDAAGGMTALIVCDHIMAQKNGVDFLIELNKDDRFQSTKKILLTGLATHQDTIAAINMASIDRYIEKPWNPEQFITIIKTLITQFIMRAGIDHQPFMAILDPDTLYQEMKNRT